MTAVVTIAVGLAALAGTMMAPVTGVHPAMGAEILTFAFVVVVIGGLGSFWGVVFAALIVGVVRGITAYAYPPATEAAVYGLMVLVLLLRPRPVRRADRPIRVSGSSPMSGTAEPLPLAMPQRGLILRESRQLWAALAALIVLPFALDAIGLTLITATDVVIFALAVLGSTSWSAGPAWSPSATARGSGSAPTRWRSCRPAWRPETWPCHSSARWRSPASPPWPAAH